MENRKYRIWCIIDPWVQSELEDHSFDALHYALGGAGNRIETLHLRKHRIFVAIYNIYRKKSLTFMMHPHIFGAW